jgi:predicted Ser/Thr protein kinase
LPLRPGERAFLGGYELLGRLGEGGMGTVYLGRGDNGLRVAIKTVRPEFSHEAEFRERFRSEVNRAKQVPPFSTAEVLGADPDHDPPYLIVEYVDGPSLATVVKDHGPLSGSALHGVAVGIATALTAIHGAGVIHRDLKPGNVLLAQGGVKVIDFGIARAFEATSQHTRTDQMVGTVAYMAPERFDPANGRQVTAAADIFAWGTVVAYAARGRTPFAADSAPATAMRILTQPPDLAGVPESLRTLVERALAKDPDERPTARELLDVLLAGGATPPETAAAVAATASGALDKAPVVNAGVAQTATALRPGVQRRSGHRSAWVAIAVLVLLLAGGLVGLNTMRNRGNDPGTSPQAVGGSSSAQPQPSPSDANASILRGNRRTLIHLAEFDKDLALDYDSSEAKAGDGTGPRSLFVLVPMGVDYLIKSLRGEGETDDAATCLGVKIIPDRSSTLVAAQCAGTQATLFSLAPTGQKDDKGRPTYLIRNEAYGFVQWSAERKAVFVEEVGDATSTTTFSFVDRGPV